jgi:hypothetical protein
MASGLRLNVVLPTLFLAGGLVGCGSSSGLPEPAERLPGKWHGEMIVYIDQVKDRLPPEKIAELMQLQMDFDFRTDGSMALTGANSGRTYTTLGRWQKIKQEGDQLTIKSIEEGGETKDINIEFEGSDIFYIPLQTEVAELGAMRFTRMR